MPAGLVSISSSSIVGNSGQETLQNLYIPIPTPLMGIQELTFGSATYVALTTPAGATLMVIVPPPSNAIRLFLSATSSAGIEISPVNPTLVSFPAAGPTGTYELGTLAAVTAGSIEVSYF